MYQISSLHSNQFVTCGNYGSFWFFNRRKEGSWVSKSINFPTQHAHFALEVYNKYLKHYIVNNYVGTTNLMDDSGSIVTNLDIYDSNLQNLIIQEDLIVAVDYSGNAHLYSKDVSSKYTYRKVQTIDCDSKTKIYPHNSFPHTNDWLWLWRKESRDFTRYSLF